LTVCQGVFMKIGKKIKVARENAGLTQVELAKKSGVSEKSIRRYEADDANVTLSILEKLAKALQIETTYFLSPSQETVSPSMSPSVSKSQSYNYSTNEQEIILNLRKLDQDEQEAYYHEIKAKALRMDYERKKGEFQGINRPVSHSA
jgi:transcriptional regulator with XRE-family HTH domain